MAPIPRAGVALVTLLLLTAGCGDGRAPADGAALAECRGRMDTLRSENDRLQAQISRAQSQKTDLQSRLDNLAVREAELSRWAQQVAGRFGPSVWFVGPDEKPLPYESIRGATAQRLIGRLNDLFEQSRLPRAILQKIEGDTAFVHIEDEQRLTQEMGSTGATAYLQAVTYTLTSVPAIRQVAFDFQAGDHALPGIYSR